jgi:hypothetical protein
MDACKTVHCGVVALLCWRSWQAVMKKGRLGGAFPLRYANQEPPAYASMMAWIDRAARNCLNYHRFTLNVFICVAG